MQKASLNKSSDPNLAQLRPSAAAEYVVHLPLTGSSPIRGTIAGRETLITAVVHEVGIGGRGGEQFESSERFAIIQPPGV